MLNFNINQEKHSFDNLHSTRDDVQIETEGSISAVAIFSTCSSANLIVSKTACDNFLKMFNMKQKKRWSVEFFLCTKAKKMTRLDLNFNFDLEICET